MKRFCLTLCHIVLYGTIGVPATEGRSGEFSPHRALYDLSLVDARSGSGISNATGKMAVEWVYSCDGWAFQYHSVIDVTFLEGTPVRLTTNATSWESSDSRDYRFNVRHKTNGTEMERIEGVAKLTGADGSGHALFTHPEPLKMDLPAGILFPVAHSLAIMRRAKKGKIPHVFSRTIFDGMDAKGLYQVNAVIGSVKPGQKDNPVAAKVMKDLPSWSLDLAYFAKSSNKSVPDHEIKMRLFANGVADELIMNFEEFIVRARLHRLEFLAEPTCR